MAALVELSGIAFCEGCGEAYTEEIGRETDDWVILCPACWTELVNDPDWAECAIDRFRLRFRRALLRLGSIGDLGLKVVVVGSALYFFFEIGRVVLRGVTGGL